MSERPPEPPTASCDDTEAGAPPDLWLGRQLWLRRVLNAGVTTGGATAVSRRSGPTLPLLSTLLKRRRASVAHLNGDRTALAASPTWLSAPADPADRPAVWGMPPRAVPRAAVAGSAEVAGARVSSSPAPAGMPVTEKLSRVALHRVDAAPRAMTQPTLSARPLSGGVIQRRAVAATAGATLSRADASPASLAASTPLARRESSAMAMATRPTPLGADAPAETRTVGAPRRAADAFAPHPVAIPTQIRGTGGRVGPPLRLAALVDPERPPEKAAPARVPRGVADSSPGATPSLQAQLTDDGVVHSLAGPMPVVAPDRPEVSPPEAPVGRWRGTVRAPAPIATAIAPRREPLTPWSPLHDPAGTAPRPSPSPSLAPLSLVRATAPHDAGMPLSRPRGALPLALPAAAPSARTQAGKTDVSAIHPRPWPIQSRDPWPGEAPVAATSPSSPPDARRSREPMKLGAAEIGRVSERVYQLLVDRLALERQRRGA